MTDTDALLKELDFINGFAETPMENVIVRAAALIRQQQEEISRLRGQIQVWYGPHVLSPLEAAEWGKPKE